MISSKIEKNAVTTIKTLINQHDYMSENINEDDKEISWDGFINIFSLPSQKVEDLKYRIPVQIKGKNKDSLLDRERISYAIEYKHLKNYFDLGGTFLFVVVVSNEKDRFSLFYNGLTPIKLKDLLKNSEGKTPNQTKNVVLTKLRYHSSEKLFQALSQFGHDSQQQGSGKSELVKRSIENKDIGEIDNLKITSYTKDINEMIEKIIEGEICIFGHKKDADLWLPFDFQEQKKVKISQYKRITDSLSAGGSCIYSDFESLATNESVKLLPSENLEIILSNEKDSGTNDPDKLLCTINFGAKSNLDSLRKDIQFLQELRKNKKLTLGKKTLIEFHNIVFSEAFSAKIDIWNDICTALNKFRIPITLGDKNLSTENLKSLGKLVELMTGRIVPEDTNASWYNWRWNDNIIPFFVVKEENGKSNAYPYYDMDKYIIGIVDNEVFHQIPCFSTFKRDVWSSLLYPGEDFFWEEIEKNSVDDSTLDIISWLFVELLSAYDFCGRELYYFLAEYVNNMMLNKYPEAITWIINSYQLKQRKKDLSNADLVAIEEINNNSDDLFIKCAANILLGNSYSAKRIFEQIPQDQKVIFESYPIYNLLRK